MICGFHPQTSPTAIKVNSMCRPLLDTLMSRHLVTILTSPAHPIPLWTTWISKDQVGRQYRKLEWWITLSSSLPSKNINLYIFYKFSIGCFYVWIKVWISNISSTSPAVLPWYIYGLPYPAKQKLQYSKGNYNAQKVNTSWRWTQLNNNHCNLNSIYSHLTFLMFLYTHWPISQHNTQLSTQTPNIWCASDLLLSDTSIPYGKRSLHSYRLDSQWLLLFYHWSHHSLYSTKEGSMTCFFWVRIMPCYPACCD